MRKCIPLIEYRGQHLGNRVIREAEAWIRDCGYKRITIDSRLEAEGFYLKLGFVRNGDEVVKSGPFDCVKMEKVLTDTQEAEDQHHV